MAGISILPAPGGAVISHTTTDASVVNTTTEGTLCTLAIPADIRAGDVLDIVAAGDLLNNTGANVNYTVRAKIGTTTALQSTAQSIGASTSRRMWNLRLSVVVESVTAQRVFGRIHFSASSASNWQAASFGNEGYGVAAEDLSLGKSFVLTVALGTAAATADMVLHAAALTHIRHV